MVYTYLDEKGIRCATSNLIPKSKEDILQRGRSFYEWGKWSNGMFGRTPDYKNASLMAFASSSNFLTQGTSNQTAFAQNMVNYYNKMRLNDKVLTHTLLNPIVSHQQASEGKFSDEVALHVVKETDAGICDRSTLVSNIRPLLR